MTSKQINKIVVVVGTGRSGTSLTMQILSNLGMRLSDKLLPGIKGNPEGYYEDTEILEIHKQLISDLHSSPNLPLPEIWQETEACQNALIKLKKIVKKRLLDGNAIWGFKDPRTSIFLPMWNKLFSMLGISPIFILTVRDPAAVVVSLRTMTNRDGSIFEMMWLHRNCEILHHTQGNCFIVHYEDWFVHPVEISDRLLEYTGLNEFISNQKVENLLQDTIKSSLNRSVPQSYTVQNEYVLKLYKSLKNCSGSNFERAPLMKTVNDCRKSMLGFKGWYLQASEYFSLLKVTEENAHMNKIMLKDHAGDPEKDNRGGAELEKEIEKLVLENNRLLRAGKDLFDEVEDLRKQVAGLSQVHDKHRRDQERIKKQELQIQRLDRRIQRFKIEAIELKNSFSFQFGQIFINAFRKPGKNTLLMPYFLAKLFWELASGRNKKQIDNAY